MNLKFTLIILAVLSMFSLPIPATAQRAKTNTRVFWIDRDSQKLSWGDIVTTDKWALQTGTVTGFPAATPNTTVGPLFDQNGLMIAGVTQAENDQAKGSWFAINTGVFQEPHGNHFHWKYTGRPTVIQTIEKDNQGASLRVESLNNQLYLIGDQGFTSANLNSFRNSGTTTQAGQFLPATDWPASNLAVVDYAVGYSAWPDGEGEHSGQVDVIKLSNPAKPAYSFKLPSGKVTATTVSGGKVFFAHQNAISWTMADRSGSLSSDQVKLNTVAPPSDQSLDLSVPPNSMIDEKDVVLFTTGSGASSKLCMIEAAGPRPFMTVLPIPATDGLYLSSPSTVLSLGKRYAFIFQERLQPTSDVKEQLTVVELDPNRDLRFDDARVVKTIPVGSTKIKDDAGTHQICFDDYGRFAIFTNPGDGTLSVISMHDLNLRVNFKVGGVPTNIIAVGAPEHFH